MTTERTFTTSDICLATSLVCFRHSLISVSKNETKGVFKFQNTPDLQADIKGFFSYGLLIEPMNYFNTLKTLKTRIYNHSDIC